MLIHLSNFQAFMSYRYTYDMAGFNNQSINESYIYNIPSDQIHKTDSNYTNSLPLNQTILMDSGYTNINQPISDFNDIYSYHDPNKISHQPLCQTFFSTGTGYLDNNNVYTGGNELMNTTPYGYVGNNNLTNSTSPSIYYLPPQTLVQTPPASILSNNAGTTNARSHAHVVIIMNADIDLERLLSIIQSC